jgi:hypothetical protein
MAPAWVTRASRPRAVVSRCCKRLVVAGEAAREQPLDEVRRLHGRSDLPLGPVPAAIAQQPPDLLDHLIQLVGGEPLTLDRRREVAALQAQRVTTGAPEDYAALTSASSSE